MMAKTLLSNTFNCVNKYKSANIHFYITSRATLKETFTATYQNPKFTPLGETKSIPPVFIWESPPSPKGGGGVKGAK